MKKVILNILVIASVITTMLFLLDGDAKEPNVLMRITEYVAMLSIVFTVISGCYFGIKKLTKRITS